MAVYAAHLTRSFQGTPSVFQVTAQEALGTTLKPALRKVIEYLSVLYPNKCSWCTHWYDELYLLFDCIVQYNYLKYYAASFSESFYGLLRVPISYSSEFSIGQRLPIDLERGSLALLVLLPYVKDKVGAIIDKWREDDEDGKLGKDTRGRLRSAAIKVYAILHLVYEGLQLVQLARYLRGGSPSHSLPMAALGLTLRNAPPQELPEDEYTWSDLFKNLSSGQIGSAALTFPMVGGAVVRGAEYGAFVVQLLRWWRDRGAPPPSLPAPPPPARAEAAAARNRCPLCAAAWRLPTALPVSGYIFCYTCISRHVRARGCCPVTSLPAAESSLVRVYLDTQ
ncbi:peroxisome assembly protein 12 [Bombyx mandarina]|uniref:Peroxisome assembly protein 12 n=1 Tax=Bombyx mandarina TaxID=7092 RepID=A0A6J2JY17_BOMMA|nr:peroxisome assembly protein 12 [Bombyx mandarina]